uniref:Uncharacterized protein n=1 Tax=Tanacetum cinerariifolium TaxID=118510 RepID=A0A6L2K0K7_TANCI|nr:hypothetical protein [Tanacetum cinerariifolium]
MYGFKECASCEALCNKSCGCSKGGFVDKFIRNLNKTPNSSQQPPHDCLKCGNLVDGLCCRQCALLQKQLKEVWFTICDEHGFYKTFYTLPSHPITILTLLMHLKSHSSSMRTPVKILHKVLHILTTIVVTGVYGNEHLDTISTTKSDEVIKSSVEDLVPIPSESEGIPDNMCDVPFRDNSTPLDISKDQFKDFSDSNDDSTSVDDDYFSIDDIDYVEASPPDYEIVSLEEVKDDIHCEKLSKINLLIAKNESLNENPTPDHVFKSPSPFPIPIEDKETSSGSITTHVDYSLPKYDSFVFKIKPDQGELTIVVMKDILGEPQKNSGSTTIHADISLPDLECFYFKSEPDLGELTSIVDSRIRENVSSSKNANPFEDDHSPLFPYVVWIFLFLLTYHVVPPYLLSSENEDTIFDPGISIYHSFMPGVSHRSGTFMKFNVYPNHLNESSMEILSSTCSPIDQ